MIPALHRRAKALICALMLVFLGTNTGCEPDYEGLSVQLISTPPEQLPIEVGYPWIRLPEGVALAVEVQPQSSNQEAFASDARLRLESQAPTVASLLPTATPRRFVVVGSSVGTASVQIFVDDEPLGRMSIEVTGNSR